MSGEAKGPVASVLRGMLGLAEPFYRAAVEIRNRRFDRSRAAIGRLPRPVISIGNLTTGGTGKTPMVRWLADELRAEGRRVAVLSRGYRSGRSGMGDELTMLDIALNGAGVVPVLLRADPDRLAAGRALLAEQPGVDVFVLDDGFQHRRLARDLDIVLIDGSEPFGYGHVLPRGMLREPLAGLRRADAVIITHAEQVGADALARVRSEVLRHNPAAPVLHCMHSQVGLRTGESAASAPADRPMDELAARPFFVFSGIGNPAAFESQLAVFAGSYRGQRRFGDHHSYTADDLERLSREAERAGAEVLVTTEKDWVKIKPLAAARAGPPIWRVDVRLNFPDADEEDALKELIRTRLARNGQDPSR